MFKKGSGGGKSSSGLNRVSNCRKNPTSAGALLFIAIDESLVGGKGALPVTGGTDGNGGGGGG